MTLDEALEHLEGNGPLPEYGPLRIASLKIADVLLQADVAHDAARLARVRRLLHKVGDNSLQRAVTFCWVRAELTLGNHAAVAQAIWASPYPARFFDAAIAALPTAWPLVRILLERGLDALGNAASNLVELATALVAPDAPDSDARFAELCTLSRSIAARALAQLRWSRKVSIAARLPPLVTRSDDADGDVSVAMRAAAESGESLAALEPQVADAMFEGPHANAVAHALTLSAVRETRLLRWRDDPRPAVRVGVVWAVADDPHLIELVRDPDPAVRRAALDRIARRGFAEVEVTPLVASLEVVGQPLADLLAAGVDAETLLAACTVVATPSSLALAAALQRQRDAPTRACKTCKELPRQESWSWSGGAPKALEGLITVRDEISGDSNRGVKRCPTCSTCYTTSYWGEVDVNSMHEEWTLRRLTLGETRRALGDDAVPDWSAALVADLDHPDPHWRSEAAHELAVDLVAAKHFGRIESQLLRHASIEVPREALRVLFEQAIDAPVSAAVLELRATSSDPETCSLATTLLAVQRGSRAFDEMPLATANDYVRADVLVGRGVAPSTAFVARLVDRALAETTTTWTIDTVVEKVAFTPEHLPATLARLRAALVVPATRSRALRLVETLATRNLLDDETRAVALRQGEADLEGTLRVALAGSAPLPAALAIAVLRGRATTTVFQRLADEAAKGRDLAWAIAPLAANALSFPETYDATALLHELAKRGVDLTDAVRDLTAALDSAMAYATEAAARALARHHMNRGETDAMLALLAHSLPTVRGAAATPLAEMTNVPAPIIARLQAMTTEPAWYPRGEAISALRSLRKQ